MCGNGRDGQLGIGDERNRLIPSKLKNLPSISQVSCGNFHTAFVTKGGDIYMCGRGEHGQLGTGDGESRLIPTKITIR